MRVLVTGGAGFIGSHLTDGFLEQGHEVQVLDSLISGKRKNLPEGVDLQVLDIRDPEAAVAIGKFAPQLICHQAAQMDVRRSVEDPGFDAHVNVAGLVNVIEAGRKGGALEHILFASSGGAMYGEQDEFPATETHASKPASPYGLAKAVGEQYLELFHRMYGITYTALRYANVYGPRQDAHGEAGVVAIFCGKIANGEPITVFGDGKQTRDYTFVHDVVAANMAAAEKRLLGGYNVGTGVETDVLELANQLMSIADKEVEIRHEPARKGEQMRSVITSKKLLGDAGFEPATKIQDGLRSTYQALTR